MPPGRWAARRTGETGGGMRRVAKPRVTVMMGGPSSEYAVSLESGRAIFAALGETGRYLVDGIVVGPDGSWWPVAEPAAVAQWQAPPARPERLRDKVVAGARLLAHTDVAFLAFHGRFGEDGTVQGFLETLGIPYTGSGRLASALAMDKSMAKRVLAACGVPVPDGVAADALALGEGVAALVAAVERRLGWPVVVKPTSGGSSIGVTMVTEAAGLPAALERAGWPQALVERRLRGREVTCAVWERHDGRLVPLPIVEIVPKRSEFFDFASKYDAAATDEICPARLDPATAAAVAELAVRAHRALGCRGLSRVDFMLAEEGPVVLEVNTIPGMTATSLLPKAVRAAGWSLAEVAAELVELARAAPPR